MLQNAGWTPRLAKLTGRNVGRSPPWSLPSKRWTSFTPKNGAGTRSQNAKPSYRLYGTLAAGALLAGVTTTSTPSSVVQEVRFRRTLADVESSDPLDILEPHALAASTDHLTGIPMGKLIRAYIVFLVSGSTLLVDIAPTAIQTLESLRDNLPFGIGAAIWRGVRFGMRQTFFAQFVAGETAEGSYPLMQKLFDRSCGAMLNWSSEAEHAHVDEEQSQKSEPLVMRRSVEELERAVKACAGFQAQMVARPSTLAIKLSGMVVDPSVFERGTEALRSSTAYARGQPLPADQLVPQAPQLTPSDLATLKGLHSDLRNLCHLAQSNGVRLIFDAEQSWFQPCLDRLVSVLAEEFNKTEDRLPTIYNTYQANLRGTDETIRRDLAAGKTGGYKVGFKLVRGAYVPAEHARAKSTNAPTRAWSTKAETDEHFALCSSIVLEEVLQSLDDNTTGPSIIFATHNASSIRDSLLQLRERGLISDHKSTNSLLVDERIRGRVGYAQLLGMTDNLTTAMMKLFPMPSEGTIVLPVNSLYVPYGAIDEVLPYLVRRAQENKSILQGSDGSGRGGAAESRRAIGREMRRRLYFPF